MPVAKKQKLMKSPENRCQFYLEKKQRQCSMQSRKGQKFCLEHLAFDPSDKAVKVKGQRVPCPLDPKHTVWEKDLEYHLKKCNAKPKEVNDKWFVKNMNTKFGSDDVLHEDDQEIDVTECIDILEKFISSKEELSFSVKEHPGLDLWHLEKENKKHILQQSSLCGNLKEKGLLSTNNFYVEFGCGKAELSRSINACNLHDFSTSDHYGFGLVDRGVNRMKNDSKIIKENEESGHKFNISIKRSRIDIEHLSLDLFLEDMEPLNSIVGVSKHLCGVATDLTLKLLLHSKYPENKTFSGLLVAMCCRHVCSYEQLLPESREFLKDHGIKSAKAFQVLKKIVSWAVSGRREEVNPGALSYEEKERLGLAARRLIDESRAHAARKALPGYTVQLFNYITRDITLENCALLISKN